MTDAADEGVGPGDESGADLGLFNADSVAEVPSKYLGSSIHVRA